VHISIFIGKITDIVFVIRYLTHFVLSGLHMRVVANETLQLSVNIDRFQVLLYEVWYSYHYIPSICCYLTRVPFNDYRNLTDTRA